MKTCLLIDGSENPVALRLADVDCSKPYLQWGRVNQPPAELKFIRAEGEEKEILVFRSLDPKLTDEKFEASAQLEVDKVLNPDKYREIERANAAAMRRT